MDTETIKVMLVDDSAVVRQTLSDILNADPEIEVLHACADPFIAAQKLREQVPDVMVLDIEMPRMDGITFLKKIMSQHPIPVIICSSLVEKGSKATLKALEYGALDIIQKPTVGTRKFLEESRVQLTDAVKAAARATVRRIQTVSKPVSSKLSADAVVPATSIQPTRVTTDRVIVIGASTGGTEAVKEVLLQMPPTAPGIVVVQHMPAGFTSSFAQRLNECCPLDVREACNGDAVTSGQVLIAPGGKHTLLKRRGSQYYVEIKDGPLVSRHRPSVDVLFRSAALYAGKNAVAAILTGMGDDGAAGMKELHDTGAYTIAQDAATCVVHGMPAMAVKQGGVDVELPLQKIAAALINRPSSGRQRRAAATG